MEDTTIRVENVSKTFKLPHEKQSSVKSAFVNVFRSKKGYELQQALDNISFEVKKGEFFGIVGRNGSGKSTLLKLLAGIYTPSGGTIQVNGKLTPFIELGVGFNPELTGRENVYLNGALLGFSRREMKKMYKDIVDFAELQRFMDQKLKNYSSGMQVRLAFSIAIRAKSDILLIDEVLAVGDAAFQRKCFNYFGDLKKNKQTVVFVSHDMASVRQYCDKAILIDGGKIIAAGDSNKVIAEYLRIFMNEESKASGAAQPADNRLPLGMSAMVNIDHEAAEIKNVWVENKLGEKVKRISDNDSEFSVKLTIKCHKDMPEIVPGVIITNSQGEFITASNSQWSGRDYHHPVKTGSVLKYSFKLPNIYERGDYKVSVNVVSDDLETFYDWKNEAVPLRVEREHLTGAKSNPKFEVLIEDD